MIQTTPDNTRARRDSIIAAIITLIVALLIVLCLVLGHISYPISQFAQDSTPELMAPEEEELFVEPEILEDLGEPDATSHDAPAPVQQGEPKPAPVENNKIVTPGENTKPAPQVEKLVSTKKDSPVKTTDPPATNEEASAITSSMANKFGGKNGQPSGATGSNGAGGTGSGIKGHANGRTFMGCPSPYVELRTPVTITVTVMIDAEGKVVSAKATGGTSAAQRQACEKAAMQARWSPKKGEAQTRGTLTFNITPRY